MTLQPSGPPDPGPGESGQQEQGQGGELKYQTVIPISEGMRQKLTVLIPCKNERRHARSCIEFARSIRHSVAAEGLCDVA
ncbi:MAG: hypothetical protein ACYC0X_32635 [Pirellulaceae bacterium]